MLSVVMLNVANKPFRLSVIILNVVMPNVVAPTSGLFYQPSVYLAHFPSQKTK
jgi:hypothetical protein